MNETKDLTFRHASFRGRIGIARHDITPPVGVYFRNWGAAKYDVATSIHRPLTLTSLVLSPLAGNEQLVLVDADLGWWKSLLTFRKFQTRLLDELSLEASQLIFALSHTHSGPQLMDADDSLPGGHLLRTYMESLFDTTVRAIRDSQASQFEGILDWHTGRCCLAMDRDQPDPDPHQQRIICGFHPNAEPDDTLLVGRITDTTGNLRATLVNYACHPTTLAWDNTAISPDYLGSMRTTIQDSTGAPALFLLGACGELAPRYQYVGDPEVADQHGRQLAFAALATVEGMEPPETCLSFAGTVESGAPLAVWEREPCEVSQELRAKQTTSELDLKDWPSAEELERQWRSCTDRPQQERLLRKCNIRRCLGDESHFRLPIYTWRIGDAVFVGSCCEPYSSFQRELRRRFDDRPIVCINLINGTLGYLPPAELYDTEVYQVWQTPFDRGCLEKVLESSSSAIDDVLKI